MDLRLEAQPRNGILCLSGWWTSGWRCLSYWRTKWRERWFIREDLLLISILSSKRTSVLWQATLELIELIGTFEFSIYSYTFSVGFHEGCLFSKRMVDWGAIPQIIRQLLRRHLLQGCGRPLLILELLAAIIVCWKVWRMLARHVLWPVIRIHILYSLGINFAFRFHFIL